MQTSLNKSEGTLLALLAGRTRGRQKAEAGLQESRLLHAASAASATKMECRVERIKHPSEAPLLCVSALQCPRSKGPFIWWDEPGSCVHPGADSGEAVGHAVTVDLVSPCPHLTSS